MLSASRGCADPDSKLVPQQAPGRVICSHNDMSAHHTVGIEPQAIKVTSDPIHLCITYASADQISANWIAEQLRQRKYTTLLAVTDVDDPERPTLTQALQRSEFVIMVLSPNFFGSVRADETWAVVSDIGDRLIPVRVRSFHSPSHLAEGRYIDLAGLDPSEAGRKLVDQVQERIQQLQQRASDVQSDHLPLTAARLPEPRLANDQWTTVDRLGFQVYVSAITQFILHPQTRAPFTIGINGRWGAGKTSLMRMIQENLDPTDAKTGKRGEIRLTSHSQLLLAEPTQLRHRRKAYIHFRWPWRSRKASERPEPPGPVTLAETVERAEESTEEKQRRLQDLQVEPPGSAKEGLAPRSSWRPTIWFNPWIYQTEEQVWAGLAHAIIDQITSRMQPLERERFWLTLNLSRIDGSEIRSRVTKLLIGRLLSLAFILIPLLLLFLGALIAGAAVLAGFVASGGAVAVALGSALSWWRLLRTDTSKTFQSLLREPNYAKVDPSGPIVEMVAQPITVPLSDPGYQGRLGFFHIVQEDLKRVLNLVSTSERPVVIFIDDLDRCSPIVASQVIEAISLFVAGTFPNSIFAIAMEPGIVASNIETAQNSSNPKRNRSDTWDREPIGWMFLDKIVQLPFSMPYPDRDRISSYVDAFSAVPSDAADVSDSASPELTPADIKIVAKIADEIRQSDPHLYQISEQAERIQVDLSSSTHDYSLESLRIIAARQVFTELFNDQQVEVRDAVPGWSALDGN